MYTRFVNINKHCGASDIHYCQLLAIGEILVGIAASLVGDSKTLQTHLSFSIIKSDGLLNDIKSATEADEKRERIGTVVRVTYYRAYIPLAYALTAGWSEEQKPYADVSTKEFEWLHDPENRNNCNILCLNFGIMLGITPAHIRLYMDEKTPLNRVADDVEATWISSSIFASAALSSIVCGFIVGKIGPKAVLLLSGLLQISSWFCMHFAFDILHIYSSRIMAGTAAGAALIALPIFIAEISEEINSGALIVTIEQWRTMGTLIGFLLGQHLQYDYVAVVAVCISCAFTMMFPFSQESPYFYMRKGDVSRLEKSLRWFRGVRSIDDRNRPEFIRELEDFKSNMDNNFIADEHVPRAYLCKATLCTLVLFVGVHLSGIYVILAWSDLIFINDVFVQFPTDVSALIFALVQFVAATMSVWLAPIARRRILLFISALICGFASICLAVCMALEVNGELRWVASVLLLLHVFFANLGLYPLIFLIPREMLATKLRVTLTSLSWGLSWLITFILIQYFQSFETAFGLYGYFIIFGVGCVSVALLALFALPETLGKSLEEVQNRWGLESQAGISKSNVPQRGQIHLERY